MCCFIKSGSMINPPLSWISFVLVSVLITNPALTDQFLDISCSDNVVPNYELNSPFHKTLTALFSSLPKHTAKNKGFYKTSVGNGSDQVYGRALCRGDASPTVCKICVKNASLEIMNNCRKQAAVIWLEKCQLEYSYRTLSTEYTGKYPDLNLERVFDNSSQFCSALNELKANLSDLAGRSKLKFATGKFKFSRNETLYGLVQCTTDLSPGECGTCLTSAFGDLNACESSKVGAVLSRTCSLRFQLYQFYNSEHTKGRRRSKAFKAVAVAVSGCAGLVIIALIIVFGSLHALRKQKRNTEAREEIREDPVLLENLTLTTGIDEIEEENQTLTDPQELPFSIIKAATDNFSESCKLGRGGFGTVYKGVMPDGKVVAVKRLSMRSWQGSPEFKNEIRLLGKLQHRNLVRLLCFCMEGVEKLLIYEYMPNKSLDLFLFDRDKRMLLDWNKRLNIIRGIAKGLVYLHEESRVKIVHRDLKPSNVLLDHEMSAKISDFGMARMFYGDQYMANTKNVVGTPGYVAPEYLIDGQFSFKSDVFSFGVILLEIISGKKNSESHLTQHAWLLWKDGQELELVDPALTESCPMEEVERCILIGLLCVQEQPSQRPTMSEVVILLESKSIAELPEPRKPVYPGGTGNQIDAARWDSHSMTDPSINLITVSSIVPR